jgi:hypothetical protein
MVTWVAQLTTAATVSFGVVGSSQALHSDSRLVFWESQKFKKELSNISNI